MIINFNLISRTYYLQQRSTVKKIMGFELQDYPYPMTTALICNPQSIGLFQSALTIAIQNICDNFISPIFPDSYLSNCEQNLSLDHCYILSDEHLKRFQLNIIVPFVNQCIWRLPLSRRIGVLKLLIGYSTYLNLRYFAIKLNEDNFASITQTLSHPQVDKQVRKSVPNLILLVETSGDNDQQGKADDKIWNNYINFTKKLQQIKFCLNVDVGLQLKPNCPLKRIINRWKSQKISYIVMGKQCFTQNTKGFAILPAKHERITNQLIISKGTFTINLQNAQDFQNDHRNIQTYFKYGLYAFRKYIQNKLRSQKQAINLMDYLQNPLQPYADNLQSATYEVFQFDQQKYDEYQCAIQQALQTFPKNKNIVIYYIGAGRGGLLFNVFSAAKKTQRKVFVYAIEKNLYPIQTIKKRIRENKWDKMMKIIHTDIRDYQMTEKPDIFLSELLGGFGDNQLSPQCLYWAQKNIYPDTICIPTNYISYIRPVSYQNNHRKIQNNLRQMYYTVNFGNYYTNFGTQQVWRFTHPIRNPKLGNASNEKGQKIMQQQQKQNVQKLFDRYSCNKFTTKDDVVINGFAGYFTSQLYNQIEMSILPERPTFGMYSWFPLFFCFQNAQYLAKGQTIQIQLWRKGNDKKVWYQWRYKICEKLSIVHNKDGESVAIQL